VLFSRAIQVIRAPRRTFETVISDPHWAGVLLLSFAISAAAGIALLSTEIGRLALVDQWVNSAEAFGRTVDDGLYDRLDALSARGPAIAVGLAALNGPLLTLVAALLLYGCVSRGARKASFREVLAVAAHVGVLLALRQVIAAPLRYARESLAAPTTLGIAFPMLEEGSPLARLLWLVDAMVVWWLIVLAIGASVLYGRRARPLAVSFLIAYVLGAVLLAGVMALFGGTA
jgi:hypothetical protein